MTVTPADARTLRVVARLLEHLPERMRAAHLAQKLDALAEKIETLNRED